MVERERERIKVMKEEESFKVKTGMSAKCCRLGMEKAATRTRRRR